MKTLKITLLTLLLSCSVFAQGGRIKAEMKEQVKALKVAFFTKELDLTSTEAEKFWPIYNDFDTKNFDIRFTKMRALKTKLDGVDSLSDKEAQSLLNQMESADEELYQNRKKLVSNLKGVISPVKILKLKKAEDDFNRKLLKQYRDKGPEKP